MWQSLNDIHAEPNENPLCYNEGMEEIEDLDFLANQKGMTKKEYINWLKTQEPDTLTSFQKKMRNLNMFAEGRKNGRKKGVKNWGTKFHKLMGDEKFLKTILKKTPEEWNDIVDKTPADMLAGAIIAIALQGTMKAMVEQKPLSKDVREALKLVNKFAYGDTKNIRFDNEDSLFNSNKLEIVRVAKNEVDAIGQAD